MGSQPNFFHGTRILSFPIEAAAKIIGQVGKKSDHRQIRVASSLILNSSLAKQQLALRKRIIYSV